ncbi:MAG: phosphoribosylpyrophosphate synthetase [Deltaproteobacteria bacterium]|nr:phosphoribosylpyrophosphate synthetase [Deltaproteobacteria bacterium]MBM2839149.1 phosphoribosylpyrophosphate synthetase [Deltaproteobacteria bacterium]
MEKLKLFSGNSNRPLAQEMCDSLGIQLGKATVKRFSDGEIFVEIEENVRGADVFVVQSTCCPGNDNLMELLIMMDALKRASAKRITAVLPYYGYARQDRKVAPRTPITAKLVADLITTAGADRILCMDLHAGQIQGFFNIPVDHLYATPVILDYIKKNFDDDIVIVSPDAGGVERARAFAKRLNCSLAIIDKRRTAPNVAEVMNIIGDVVGKVAIMVDDMVDTAGTLTQGAKAVKDNGAKKIYAISTHPVLSGPAISRIEQSVMEELVVTNTIPLTKEGAACKKIKVLSVSSLLAEAIKRVYIGDSVSSLFV